MAKTNTENTIEVKLETAFNVHLPILKRLFPMVGGSIAFKRAVKAIYEELDAKVYSALSDVREASKDLQVASEEQKPEAKQKLDNVLALASKVTIKLDAPKIPASLLPDETNVLSRTWNEQGVDPATGQPVYKQGDYSTDVVTIEDIYFDLNA